MSNFAPSSPRIVSAGFLAMCATASMGTPPVSAPTSPGPSSFHPMTAPTKFVPNFFSFNTNTPDLSLGNPSLIRRVKPVLTERVPAPKAASPISNRKIMDLADLGVDLAELKLGPKTKFDDSALGLSASEFKYLSKDERGEVHTDINTTGLGLGLSMADDSNAIPKPDNIILRSCLKGRCNNSDEDKPKRRVTFSSFRQVFWPVFYPTELEAKTEIQRQYEESEMASEAFRRLAEHMAERRRRRTELIKKSFGDVGQGLPVPLTSRSSHSRRVCFAQDLLITRYCLNDMNFKPQQETRIMVRSKERGRLYRADVALDKNLPIGVRLRQASKRVETLLNEWRMPKSPRPQYVAPPSPQLHPVQMPDNMSPMQPLSSPALANNFASPLSL